ncbi:MAG: GLUG motif-containing protein [Rikenellaceae bacterium]
MKRNSLFFIVFLTVLSFVGCSTDDEIERVEETIYISTAEELVAIKNEVNTGDDKELVTYILKNNIDLNGSEDNQWRCIGTTYYPFRGTFDGAGYTISGLYIDNEFGEEEGLFGYLGMGGVIKNLVVDGYINIDSRGGAVVGSVFYGTVQNCHNVGYIAGNGYIGGVVGKISYYGLVSECSNLGTVDGVAQYIGGVVGYNNYFSTVEHCYNSGEVYCGGSVYGQEYNNCVGGIVGINYGSTIASCHNIGVVDSGRKNTGGIAGYNNAGTIVNCYNTGDVTNTEYYIGGIAGYNTDYGTIANCYNTGAISTSSRYVGGIVGSTDGTVMYNYNIGHITGTNSYIGGIAGISGIYSSTVLYNNYYQENTVLVNNSYTDGGIELTVEEMQSDNFVTALNDNVYLYNSENTTEVQLGTWRTDPNTGYPNFEYELDL